MAVRFTISLRMITVKTIKISLRRETEIIWKIYLYVKLNQNYPVKCLITTRWKKQNSNFSANLQTLNT